MKFAILSILLMGAVGMSAQKLHTHYSFLPQEGGNLYFIMPQKGFQTQDKEAKKGLVYDVTYLYSQDSATFNYTYYYLKTFATDSFYVSDATGKSLYAAPSALLYTHPKGKYWIHRETVKVPYQVLKSFYQSSSPIRITLIARDGQRITYTMPPSKWAKHCALMQNIFTLADLNR
ncbi:hypothetical protein [Bacteroides heparinolyticus]|uniref:hypothetical protein n=1 Tax=Prevotella heparinolytica TaxID=28113 RepID=UPI0035A1C183